jgi:hypothetical protein
MPYAEALRQTRSRIDQQPHAPFYVKYEVIEKIFQPEVHPNASEFADVINLEIEKVNSHVVACLRVLESAPPTSYSELVRCSAECGSVVTFIHCNRNALLELAKEFEEKMRRTTCEPCTGVSMRTIKAASFCTSLLERMLNVQARLEESVPKQHGVDCSLRRLLTEVYEVSAGLSENASTSVRVTAPAAPCIPSLPTASRPIPARSASAGPSQANSAPPRRQAFYGPRSSASRRNRRVHRPRVTNSLPPVETPPPAAETGYAAEGTATRASGSTWIPPCWWGSMGRDLIR